MANNFRVTKVTLMIGILLISCVIATLIYHPESTTVEAADPLIAFHSYLKIDYDPSVLDFPLEIDKVYTVPLTIKYSTDVPAGLTSGMLKRIWLFGTFIVPFPKLHVEVMEEFSWAAISIDNPDVYVDKIPTDDEGATEVNVNLVISPRREAPAQPEDIPVTAEIQRVGRLLGGNISTNIKFVPAYIPRIEIFTEKPTRIAGPREPVDFKIRVKNNANKNTIVMVDIVTASSDWAPIVNPTDVEIAPGDSEEIIFSVIPPYGFGWHNYVEAMELEFTPYSSPISGPLGNASKGPPVSVHLRVNNYGFSVPGFELIVFIAAFILVSLLLKKKYKS